MKRLACPSLRINFGMHTPLFYLKQAFPFKDAQDLLGHATAAMTQDIYTHLRSSRKQQTADLLNQKIDEVFWKKA